MKYLIPKATSTVTNETVMERDLANGRYPLNQRRFAENSAALLAAKMTRRTGDVWVARVEEYTPGVVRAKN
jgi:hypothetical protein